MIELLLLAQLAVSVSPVYWTVDIRTVPAEVVINKVPLSTYPYDFVSIVPQGSPQATYTYWKYINTATIGKLVFTDIPPGVYEVRHFLLQPKHPAPGTLLNKSTITVPKPVARPFGLSGMDKLSIAHKLTNDKGDIFLTIKEDETEVSAIVDKDQVINVMP